MSYTEVFSDEFDHPSFSTEKLTTLSPAALAQKLSPPHDDDIPRGYSNLPEVAACQKSVYEAYGINPDSSKNPWETQIFKGMIDPIFSTGEMLVQLRIMTQIQPDKLQQILRDMMTHMGPMILSTIKELLRDAFGFLTLQPYRIGRLLTKVALKFLLGILGQFMGTATVIEKTTSNARKILGENVSMTKGINKVEQIAKNTLTREGNDTSIGIAKKITAGTIATNTVKTVQTEAKNIATGSIIHQETKQEQNKNTITKK